jgi:hypothetical protein
MSARLLITSLSLMFAATTAFAQNAEAPAASASAAQDCVPQKPRHDHGAERGMPTPQKKCAPEKKTAKAKSNAIQGHDHGKVHKNQ